MYLKNINIGSDISIWRNGVSDYSNTGKDNKQVVPVQGIEKNFIDPLNSCTI